MSFNPDLWLAKILDSAEYVLRQAQDCEILAVTSTSARKGVVLIADYALLGLPNKDMRGKHIVKKFRSQRLAVNGSVMPVTVK